MDEPRRAAGPLSRECYGRPDESLTLVGITGTNGKTTTAHLLESIGQTAGWSCGIIGTVGGSFARRQTALQRTTPEAPEFFRLLADMRDHGVQLVAAEVSSHALALHRVEGARFATGVFLNLSPDHLDFHADEEDYFSAKLRLFEGLSADDTAVLPADDHRGSRIAERTRAQVITFGHKGADVCLTDERSGLDGSSATLRTPVGRLPVRTFLLGRHNLDNVAAAAATALALELPAESIPGGVMALERVPGRTERVDAGQPFSVVVDYAHTPEGLKRLLEWLHEIAPKRLIVVFGCGGSRDQTKRGPMGRTAARLADVVIMTSDNPRDEDPEAILDQIASGAATACRNPAHCRRIADRAEAIDVALREARPNDVVIIAGKGHETTQLIGKRVLPFDDRQVARQRLGALGFQGMGHADA